MLLNRKAQSTAEYVIVLGLITAVVLAMQTYIKRGFQGRVKDAVDYVGTKDTTATNAPTFQGKQYEPYYLSSSFDNARTSNESEDVKDGGGKVDRATNDQSTRSGNQKIGRTVN